MHTDYTIVLLPKPQNRDTLPPGNPRSRIHVSLACIGIDSLCSALEWTLDVHLMSGLAICLALDIGISGHEWKEEALNGLRFLFGFLYSCDPPRAHALGNCWQKSKWVRVA